MCTSTPMCLTGMQQDTHHKLCQQMLPHIQTIKDNLNQRSRMAGCTRRFIPASCQKNNLCSGILATQAGLWVACLVEASQVVVEDDMLLL